MSNKGFCYQVEGKIGQRFGKAHFMNPVFDRGQKSSKIFFNTKITETTVSLHEKKEIDGFKLTYGPVITQQFYQLEPNKLYLKSVQNTLFGIEAKVAKNFFKNTDFFGLARLNPYNIGVMNLEKKGKNSEVKGYQSFYLKQLQFSFGASYQIAKKCSLTTELNFLSLDSLEVFDGKIDVERKNKSYSYQASGNAYLKTPKDHSVSKALSFGFTWKV